MVRGSVGLALLAALAVPLPAAAGSLTRVALDPAGSHLDFELKATLHTVHGSLQITRGEIAFDPETGRAQGEVVIDARSARTGSDSRDENMHRDVLESERFPEISFLPERVAVLERGESAARIELSGTVSLHGVREPLVIPADVRREGDGVRIDASFPVPYVQWGLHDPSVFVLRVAPEVTIHLDLVASLDEAASSDSAPE